MREYFSEAVVLTKEPNGDLDSRVAFYTKRFGKISAKAKSARKITSKLSGHLEPGNLVLVRLVEKNGLQVVDTLKERRLTVPPSSLFILEKLLADFEPEGGLWRLFTEDAFRWKDVLRILGWDPNEAECRGCGRKSPSFFEARTQEFFCGSCASHAPQNELLYIE